MVAIALLSSSRTKNQKLIKIQLYNEQFSIMEGCHGEKMKFDIKKEISKKSFISIFFY